MTTIKEAIAQGFHRFKVKTSVGESYLELLKVMGDKVIVKNYTTGNSISVSENRMVEGMD